MNGSLPELIKIQNEYQDVSDAFQIFAIHNSDVTDFATFDKHNARAKRESWGGKDLPFPVLLDNDWETYNAYTVGMYPTIALVDPEGNVVEFGSAEMLKEKLDEIRAVRKTTK